MKAITAELVCSRDDDSVYSPEIALGEDGRVYTTDSKLVERSPLEGEPDGRFGLVIFDGGSIAYQQTYATEAEATAAGEYLDTWFRLVDSYLDNTDVSLIVLRAVVDDPDPELATVKGVWSGEPLFEEYEAKVVISTDWRDVDASDDEDEDEA